MASAGLRKRMAHPQRPTKRSTWHGATGSQEPTRVSVTTTSSPSFAGVIESSHGRPCTAAPRAWSPGPSSSLWTGTPAARRAALALSRRLLAVCWAGPLPEHEVARAPKSSM
eukprot:10654704-Lingulodinium_polyedra.AAC.1